MERYASVLQALKAQNIRLSHPRLKVIHYLCQHLNHPTADQIYMDLHKQEPSLSKTTVYNTLHVLTKLGLVTAIKIEDTETRYDIVTHPHGHFKCEICKSVLNFEINPALLSAEMLPGFKISNRSVYFKGICPKCLEIKKANRI